MTVSREPDLAAARLHVPSLDAVRRTVSDRRLDDDLVAAFEERCCAWGFDQDQPLIRHDGAQAVQYIRLDGDVTLRLLGNAVEIRVATNPINVDGLIENGADWDRFWDSVARLARDTRTTPDHYRGTQPIGVC